MAYALESPLKGVNDPRLHRPHGYSDVAFLSRLNQAVHRSAAHCAPGLDHHWLLRTLAPLIPELEESHKNGIITPYRGAFRCGLCHQSATVLYEILRREGFDARVLGLNGHVVTEVRLDSTIYLLDPDFGVGPIRVDGVSTGQLAKDLRQRYGDRGVDAETVEYIANIFLKNEDDHYWDAAYLHNLRETQVKYLRIQRRVEELILIIGVLIQLVAMTVMIRRSS